MLTRVKVNVGYTVNMGEFNSIRFDFGIEDDVPQDSTRSAHMDKCFDFVWNKLEPQVDRARKASVA